MAHAPADRSQLHLISFMINSPINHTVVSWADPADHRVEGLGDIAYWQHIARTLERGCFDAVFFADNPASYDHFRDRSDESVRYGVCWPPHDPVPLIGIMGAATRHLGIAVTMSVSGAHPYSAVRSLSTLDCLTGGRVGWNIVTGHVRAEHRALGLEQMDHDQRYDRADEFMDVCYALWGGVEAGAILAERGSAEFADPAKVHKIRHEGRYFRCTALPPAMPSPQGRPVLFQAGSSGRGQRFALRHSDVIFSIQPHVHGMRNFMRQVREAAAAADGPVDPRVIFGVQPVLGGTEAEAQQRYRDMVERIPLDGALARLSGSLGVDFSTLDLDRPLDELGTQASRGLMAAMSAEAGGRRYTIRDAALRWGISSGMPQVIGTPEQVAAELASLWRETGCVGFNLTPTVTPSSIEAFVDEVVPLLQRAGVFRTEYASETLRGNLLG